MPTRSLVLPTTAYYCLLLPTYLDIELLDGDKATSNEAGLNGAVTIIILIQPRLPFLPE